MLEVLNFTNTETLNKLIETEFYKNNKNKFIPDYAGDPTVALRLWYDFVNRSSWCCTQLNSDYSYCWRIKLTPGYGLTKLANIDINDDHNPLINEERIDLAKLICNVVLTALRWESKFNKNENTT